MKRNYWKTAAVLTSSIASFAVAIGLSFWPQRPVSGAGGISTARTAFLSADSTADDETAAGWVAYEEKDPTDNSARTLGLFFSGTHIYGDWDTERYYNWAKAKVHLASNNGVVASGDETKTSGGTVDGAVDTWWAKYYDWEGAGDPPVTTFGYRYMVEFDLMLKGTDHNGMMESCSAACYPSGYQWGNIVPAGIDDETKNIEGNGVVDTNNNGVVSDIKLKSNSDSPIEVELGLGHGDDWDSGWKKIGPTLVQRDFRNDENQSAPVGEVGIETGMWASAESSFDGYAFDVYTQVDVSLNDLRLVIK